MIPGIPAYVTIIFLLAVALTFLLFISAIKKDKGVASVIILTWLTIQGVLAYKGFYQNTSSLPPRFILAVVPAIIFIILLWVTKNGQSFVDNFDLKKLTLLHIVRIPVEITLYWLAANKAIPELMTFAGRNFDIISGITAPVIWLICFSGKLIKNKTLLLVWNFVCLGLLVNIVINAVLSAPFSFQQFAFEQPNIAVLYFPFVWLPSFIVMIVLLSHLAAIRQLLKK
jgi:hypothetical protein